MSMKVNINEEYSPEVIKEVMDKVIKPYIPLIDEIMDEYAPVLGKIFDRLTQYSREKTMESIKYYQLHGLTQQEAILLIINGKVALAEMVHELGKSKKK